MPAQETLSRFPTLTHALFNIGETAKVFFGEPTNKLFDFFKALHVADPYEVVRISTTTTSLSASGQEPRTKSMSRLDSADANRVCWRRGRQK